MYSHANPTLPLDQSWQLDDHGGISQARFILNRLFQDFAGAFAVRLWNGSMLPIGHGSPAFTICLKQATVLRELVWFNAPTRLAEAYLDGEIEIQGDFNAAMQLRYHFESLSLPLHEKLGLVVRALMLANTHVAPTLLPEHSTLPHGDNNIAALHTETPGDFYRLWLDEQMQYSTAYFTTADQALAPAQRNQLDLICRKLRLQHGEHLLDIGCDWGGLACWAARHYGVFVHGITHSAEQQAYAVEQVKKQGLAKLVTIEVCEDLALAGTPRYDKVSSTGLYGPSHQQTVSGGFATVHRLLKPGGMFLHHGMTLESPRWQQEITHAFIRRYVSADMTLGTSQEMQEQMVSAHFDLIHVAGLRHQHALTLRHWLRRLEAQHAAAVRIAGERTYRIWRMYLTGCAIQLEQGAANMQQMLAVRR